MLFEKKVGVLGGGQLGKMLAMSAAGWHLKIRFMNPGLDCPAALVGHEVVEGDLKDFQAVYDFGKQMDVLTIEIENVNVDALKKLAEEGVEVYPEPQVLETIQDKGLQKLFYQDKGLPSPAFSLFNNEDEIKSKITSGTISYPFVQKLRKAGYDGNGVSIINSEKDLGKLLPGPSLIEDKFPIHKEIAVIVARGKNGEIKHFEPVEMVFDPEANLINLLQCPAEISDKTRNAAIDLAVRTIEAFGMIGILAVEMFVDDKGNISINEVAPRPHNSGHHTIENCITSQYEQHLRIILGMPLGSTMTISPATMVNILGEPGFKGPVRYSGLEECASIEGVKIHLYGKQSTAPNRKMGHVTIVDKTVAGAKEKAQKVSSLIKAKA
jgi:5-(carboxyamino)imidazole ribonucleotide synthase